MICVFIVWDRRFVRILNEWNIVIISLLLPESELFWTLSTCIGIFILIISLVLIGIRVSVYQKSITQKFSIRGYLLTTKNMLNRIKHQEIMNRILIDIYRNKKISSCLAFKWGTACMYFHKLPRFSTDLDFDLLDANRLIEVQSEIRKIAWKYGTIKDDILRENTIFFLLSYGVSDMNLKIEISRRIFPNEYETKNWNGLSLKIMTKPYILSHKMVALTDRTHFAQRDVFDVYYFLTHGWTWSEEIISLRTWLNSKEYIVQMIDFLEKHRGENLLIGLGEVLMDEKQKYFVKNKLLDELIFYLRWYL